jgi:hypothetical protein
MRVQHCGAKGVRTYVRRHLNITLQDETLAKRDGAIQMDGQQYTLAFPVWAGSCAHIICLDDIQAASQAPNL